MLTRTAGYLRPGLTGTRGYPAIYFYSQFKNLPWQSYFHSQFEIEKGVDPSVRSLSFFAASRGPPCGQK